MAILRDAEEAERAHALSHQISQLTFQFITPHASELLPSRNVAPYYEMPVYRTTGVSEAITARGTGMLNTSGEFPRATIFYYQLRKQPAVGHT